ncbi:serine hydrolase [Nonomuraea sp. NPDC059023]|uniref:serine hydrolase n=1 Tax=unclassified Nonomuraea TaxID=2593643 RepID=UPI00368EF617
MTSDGDRARAGVAVRRTARKIPFNARFRIASGTKAFTATVLLQLSAEGPAQRPSEARTADRGGLQRRHARAPPPRPCSRISAAPRRS